METIKKFVINLKRRPDRLEAFQKNCPFNDVEVIHGFDGKNVSAEELQIEKKTLYKLGKLKPGEKGVFISHLRIFQKIVDLNINHALIFEDDALFCEGFLVMFNKLLKEIPKDIYILYVGGRFEPYFKMKNCSNISDIIVKHNIGYSCGHDMDRTLHAYIISNELAQLCIKEFYGSINIKEAIDSWILKVCTNNSIEIYSTYPLLCHSPLISNSDIR